MPPNGLSQGNADLTDVNLILSFPSTCLLILDVIDTCVELMYMYIGNVSLFEWGKESLTWDLRVMVGKLQ